MGIPVPALLFFLFSSFRYTVFSVFIKNYQICKHSVPNTLRDLPMYGFHLTKIQMTDCPGTGSFLILMFDIFEKTVITHSIITPETKILILDDGF